MAALSHLLHAHIVPVLGVSSSADNKSFTVVFEPMLFCYPPPVTSIFCLILYSFYPFISLSLHSEKTLENFPIEMKALKGALVFLW